MKADVASILLVEDDPNDALLIQRAFAKAGATSGLYWVEDGEEAIAYLAGEGRYGDRRRYPYPALMLLDLKLPRKSGFEVLNWIRGRPRIRRLPVVVLTSSSEHRDVDLAYDMGANSYLVKPVSFEDLIGMMQLLHRYWVFYNVMPKI